MMGGRSFRDRMFFTLIAGIGSEAGGATESAFIFDTSRLPEKL